ncbi:MAG TPA: hypothetical protein VFB55_06220 [Verrucomicrobiae bacterium]|nr:hypothetical protein [Verrucomicrobiae bacterium]
MTEDEREIFQFLKPWGPVFVSAAEIARRAATKKRFHENPHWAKPILQHMTERGILESDAQGRYRIKPVRRKKADAVPPSGAGAVLVDAGMAAGAGEIAADEYYEQL